MSVWKEISNMKCPFCNSDKIEENIIYDNQIYGFSNFVSIQYKCLDCGSEF